MGGNELNCSSVRGSLPSGAECIDEHCGAQWLSSIGQGFCNSEEPEYDTAQCARDGGDCECHGIWSDPFACY